MKTSSSSSNRYIRWYRVTFLKLQWPQNIELQNLDHYIEHLKGYLKQSTLSVLIYAHTLYSYAIDPLYYQDSRCSATELGTGSTIYSLKKPKSPIWMNIFALWLDKRATSETYIYTKFRVVQGHIKVKKTEIFHKSQRNGQTLVNTSWNELILTCFSCLNKGYWM